MIKKNKLCCILVICITILPSCKKHVVNHHPTPAHTDEQQMLDNQTVAILDKVIEQEMMQVNIPIPLYDSRILPESLDAFDKETIFLGYKSSLTVEQIIDFFMSQMERYGWNLIVSFDQIMMFFENPDSYSLIVIKELENQESSISIYIKKRERTFLKARSQVVSWDE